MSILALSELIEIYLKKTGMPIPVFKKDIYGWYENSGLLLREGEYFFFTGGLYQLAPYIENLVRLMYVVERKDRKALENLVKLARTFYEPVYHILRIIIRPGKDELKRINKLILNILILLKKSGINIYYEPDLDSYSGILLHDIGNINAFIENANKVYNNIQKTNKKKIVTIDPHTTYALSVLYPKYIDNFDLEVIPYFELLDENVIEEKKMNPLVIHDSCIYAREFRLGRKIRLLLSKKTSAILEPRMSRENTSCCGGPIEFFMPSLASKIAEIRIGQLIKLSQNIIVACPICLYNFKRVVSNPNVKIMDLGEIL